MNETGVETVSSAHWIHRRDAHAGAAPFFGAFPRHSPAHTEFYDDELTQLREPLDRLLQIIGTCDFFRFTLVRKKYVNERQHVQQVASPLPFRVIVGIQRSGKSLGLGFAK